MLVAVKAQDANGTFRRLLASAAPRAGADGQLGHTLITGELGDACELKQRDWVGKRVVLLVKDSEATHMALKVSK